MPAHGEMALHAGFTKHANNALILQDVELKDKGKSDDHGIKPPGGCDDLIGRSLDVADNDGVAMLAECGGEVSQAKITLMLKADEKDGP
jgi:hypothetical protein